MSFRIIEEVERPQKKSRSKYPWANIEEGCGIFIPDDSPDKQRRPNSIKLNAERYCKRHGLDWTWEAFRIDLDGEWGVVCQRPTVYDNDEGRLL